MLLGCHCSSIRFILTISLHPLMTLCHLLLILLSSGVPILKSPLTSWPRLIIFFFFSNFLPFHLAHLSFAYLPIERCAFLYAFIIDAPMSFPYLFFRSLIEVHRSSSTTHALFFPIFIHRILLHLGLDKFSASEPVYINAPIGANFLRQRAA